MKYYLSLAWILCVGSVVAQRETYDIATFTPPKGWSKETATAMMSYSITNNATRNWAKLVIYKSIASKGNVDDDFTNDWKELVAKSLQVKGAPQTIPVKESGGWKTKSGSAAFAFNNTDAAVNLTTVSGFGKTISFVFMMNNDTYVKELGDFMAGVTLQAPLGTQTVPPPPSQKTTTPTAPSSTTTSSPSSSGGAMTSVKAAFNTTNFDDGWTAVAKADWVEVTKGSVRVVLHYPTDKIDESSMDYRVIGQNAWNTLVAPRYNTLENFYQLSNNISFEPGYLLSGTLQDNSTHKKVFVALFRKATSGWIEIICPDRATFIQTFGIDDAKVDVYFTEWQPLQKLAGYNRFAVAASDLKGKWTTSFSGLTQYYNVYTGAHAGATSHSSVQTFNFTGSAYQWQLNVASGPVGNAKFVTVKSNGTFSMVNNWQVNFSDIEGKPKKYDAYFSFLKGARILWLSDVGYPGWTGYYLANE